MAEHGKEFFFRVIITEADVELSLSPDPEFLSTRYQTPKQRFKRFGYLQLEDAMRNQLRPEFEKWLEEVWEIVSVANKEREEGLEQDSEEAR